MFYKKMVLMLTVAALVLLISPLGAAEDCCKKQAGTATMEKSCTLTQIPNLSVEQKEKLEKMCTDMHKMMAEMKAETQKKCLAQKEAVRALLNDEQKVKFDEMACGMKAGNGCQHGEKSQCGKEKPAEHGKKGMACGNDCSGCDKTKKEKK